MIQLKLIILICLLSKLNAISPNAYFANNATLVAPNNYLLYWNYTTTSITFKAVVKTTGWFGFGLSPDGGMANSDLVVAYLNENRSVNFTGRYVASSPSLPIINKVQYWKMLHYSQNNGYTTAIFSRNLTVCNAAHTIAIVPGTLFVIFAWGSSFTSNSLFKDIKYHSPANRSSTSLPLTSTINQKITLNMNQIQTVDFRVNGLLSNDDVTTYFCQMFKLPTNWLQTKRHLVRYDTLIAQNKSQYLHHWLLYECSENYEKVYNSSNQPRPGSCFAEPWLTVYQYCQKISLAWAIGGPLELYMPSNIAYPLGGPKRDFRYFYLQMHYNNLDMDKNVQDNSGIRLFVTTRYRPIEFGVLTVGAETTNYAITIPPNANLSSFDFYCRKDCARNLFNSNVKNSKINIFATLPHSHLAGRQIYSKVVRNGKEVEYLSNAKYYDFSHQYAHFLNKPVILYPNDEIKVTCYYSTLDRSGFTYGGPTTQNEMCLDFLWYYPRSPSVSMCTQLTNPDPDWKNFYNYLNRNGDIQSYLDSLGPIKTQQLFQNFFQNSSKVQVCVKNGVNDYKIYPPYKVSPIMIPDTCKTPQSKNTTSS